jgi:O-antigen/teichoic acid export membrane protein
MGTAGTIFKNTVWLTIGDKIGYALQFVFFLYFAKQYGVVPSGEYSFAFFFTYAFACLADLGASLYLLREVGRNRPQDRSLFFDCFVLRSVSLLAVSLVAAAVVLSTGDRSVQKTHLLICWGTYWLFYCLADLLLAELNGHGKSASVALLGIWLRLISAAVGIYFIYRGMNYDAVMIAFPLSSFIFLCTCIAASIKIIGSIRIRFRSLQHYGQLLVTLMPFLVSVLLSELLFCEDVLILGYLRDDRSVGIYSSAVKIVTFVTGISTFVTVSILPLMARLFMESRERLIDVSERILRYLILAGLPASVGIVMTSTKVIDLLYPNSFLAATLVLCVAGWSIAAGFMQIVFAALLTAANLQKEKMIATAVNLALATGLYIVLIRRFDNVGAAAAKSLGAIIGIACFHYLVSKHLQKIDIWRPMLKPGLACLAMAAFLYYCNAWSLLILVPAAAGVYLAGLFVLGEIRQDDIRTLKELMPKPLLQATESILGK